MSHFRNSFTLPHPFRKFKLENGKRKGGASSMPSPALPRTEPILYTGVRSGVDYYGLSMLEDFCPSKRHSAFPNFYGGYTNHSPTDSHSDYESAASESVNQSESENTSLAGSTLTSSSSAGTPEASIETSDYAQTSSKYNGESKLMYSSSGPFTDVHCCCKTNCHANAGSTYRLNLQCCHHMEPLWETGVSNTELRALKGVNWYDRKLRHRSCPIFQAHMVAAFEQSLSNMTNRLHNLTVSAEQKDSELGELRSTVDALSNQSTEAEFTKMALQSMPAVQRSFNGTNLVRRHTFNNTKEHAIQEHKISRQTSTDSMSSANSISSRNSGFGDQCDGKNKKKKKGWLRSSFSKAFSRSKKNKNGSVSDVEDVKQFLSDSSTLHSPLVRSQHKNSKIKSEQTIKASHSSSVLFEKEYDRSTELINTLKKQLREKEMVITDIRLETLTSAQQLEALKETVKKMQDEMVILKQENSRLHKLVSTKCSASSQSSLPQENSVENLVKRLSTSSHSESPSLDAYLSHTTNFQDGKYATISVFLGCHGDNTSFKAHNENVSEVLIGTFLVNSKMSWDLMDNIVNQTFKEYVQRIDPLSSLGLNTESILSYQVGEIVREKESEKPELLPCGYLVGNNMQVQVALKGANQNSVDGLSFETLIAKSIIQRYVSLLLEHRRIILCGPSGTGKTYLVQKLAEHLVLRNLKEISPGAIAVFEVDHKSAEELQQYLFTVAEQCERSNPSDLPTVIILNNLHYVGTLSEVFNGFLSARYQKCPYIIGTMNQATCSTTNLQLHHNFRWVLCANHMEPVKGFLGRYLRRKLVEHEIQSNSDNPELTKIIEWMPKVWEHLNNFLETHSSSDVTIGPKLFLSCPLDVVSSQIWFTDLWNYDIVPYIVEVVREGLQLYGLRAPWNDPADWVFKNHPWPTSGEIKWSQLLHLRPEDVGYEKWSASGAPIERQQGSSSDVEADPLLNMLMRLQEAASCSSPHDNHGDTGISTANLINEDALQSPL